MTRQDTEKQTILVVDDTPENIDVVSNALRGVFRVVAALSGDRALQIAERKPGPDLILLDVMMPVMDGYEVLRRLKENPLTRTIPVIFVTALTDVADEQKGFELGAVDYIVKPISPAIVRARVNAHLMIRRQHQDLAESLEILQRTQSELVQAEKLSGLGALVAGVAHEINTPISIVLSAATHFSALTERLKNQISRQELRQSDLQSFMTQTSEAARLMAVNAARAAKLVQSFKQVSVDQTSGERRVFKLAGYIEEVLASLSPKLKNRPITLSVDCPGDLECDTHPGALAQILTNLVMNALIHAFAETEPGTIRISAHSDANDTILLTFADDGKGIAIQDLPKIFDPFFTTRRGSGGTGLGLHIVHNLVVASLQGSIEVTSQSGTAFHIRFPARTTL